MSSTKFNLFLLSTLVLSTTNAFTTPFGNPRVAFVTKSSASYATTTPYFLDEFEASDVSQVAQSTQAPPVSQAAESSEAPVVPKKTRKMKKPNHKEGVFSPIVFASKQIAGEEIINKLRGKFISLHSGVIGDFVDTHSTPLGKEIAKNLFAIMDADKNGALDKDELKSSFQKLGFTWLEDKQVEGIIKRADKDDNGVIDYEEFEAEISKTLRVNLIKLAKKNGEEMGLLV